MLLLLAVAAPAQEWKALGPFGGDARSLALDPSNPDRIYLGTAAGTLWVSNNGGARWERLARLGSGDYALDNIEVDPADPQTLYVAAWSVTRQKEAGDLFVSRDGGKSWTTVPALHGKSIRALALAPSDPKIVLAGALDGVYRSKDRGASWELISPPRHGEIRNIESVAADPANADVIYAGTWHLPWKTEDGGATWKLIKQGVLDDSDVFSIVVDRSRPETVYLSACSGIYKSVNAAERFRRVQGIPKSAQRTRVLLQDPASPATVWAGTTEGLWKTTDAGANWRRLTPANVIVNGVAVDPRRPERVLVAADRIGVLASNDAGATFTSSNRGFSHRFVTAVIADPSDRKTLFAGVANDKEFGGVVMSRDGGENWAAFNRGLEGADVLSLAVTPGGTVLAGTNRGVYVLPHSGWRWTRAGTDRKSGRAGKRDLIDWRVNAIATAGESWLAATVRGLYVSRDSGATWNAADGTAPGEFRTLDRLGDRLVASSTASASVSLDSGATWTSLTLPAKLRVIRDAALTPSGVWLAGHEGAFFSADGGTTWTEAQGGLPLVGIESLDFDPTSRTLLASAKDGALYSSADGGKSWARDTTSWAFRAVIAESGQVFGITHFDGLVAQVGAPATSVSQQRPASE